jgi:prepilin-type N-terminal cleavage/methylation domain-containing protein
MRLPDKHEPPCFLAAPVAFLRRTNGFTLVELLTVVAVLSALALIALPAGTTYIAKARTARCLSDLQTINNEIQSYYIDKNAYPDNLSKIGRDKFMDPWGQFYEYNPGATLIGGVDPRPLNRLSNDYDLWSKGPDTQTNNPAYAAESEDDLVRASDGSFFGLRSDF